MTTNNKQPWERLPEETSKQYEAFCIYRDLGPSRSLEKCGKEMAEIGQQSYHPKYIRSLSSKHNWVSRAMSYDNYLEKLIREENELAIQEMVRRHAEESKEIQTAIKSLKEDPEIKNLTPKEKAYFFDALSRSYANMARFERLSRGVPTENIKREETKELRENFINTGTLQDQKFRAKNNKKIRSSADS
jgi:hypothetical protein